MILDCFRYKQSLSWESTTLYHSLKTNWKDSQKVIKPHHPHRVSAGVEATVFPGGQETRAALCGVTGEDGRETFCLCMIYIYLYIVLPSVSQKNRTVLRLLLWKRHSRVSYFTNPLYKWTPTNSKSCDQRLVVAQCFNFTFQGCWT